MRLGRRPKSQIVWGEVECAQVLCDKMVDFRCCRIFWGGGKDVSNARPQTIIGWAQNNEESIRCGLPGCWSAMAGTTPYCTCAKKAQTRSTQVAAERK